MLESLAFQFGLILTVVTSLFSFLTWILTVFSGCRVEAVSVFFDPWFSIWKTKVKAVELTLGWLPMGSSVKISGMIRESLDEIPAGEMEKIEPWEFRGKPFLTRALISLASPIVVTLIGFALLSNGSPMPIGEMFFLLTKIAFFIAPMDAGTVIWNEMYQNPIFLYGFFFCYIMGILNLVANVAKLLAPDNGKGETIVLILTILMLFFFVFCLRLVWASFALMNMVYFFIGSFVGGIPFVLLMLLLAKVLPNH